MQNDLKFETIFLELLGFKITEPNNSNRCMILDENDLEVGFIQKKKIYGGRKKYNKAKEFGYCMEINTEQIFCRHSRRITAEDPLCVEFNTTLKREDGTEDGLSVCIAFDDSVSFTIHSDLYGFSNFSLSSEKLFFNYKSKTENYQIEETVSLTDEKNEKKYFYTLNYCDKDADFQNYTDVVSCQFEVRCDRDSQQKTIINRLFDKGKNVETERYEVEAELGEIVALHELGIESLNHYRYLLTEILPFNQEFFYRFINIYGSKNKVISLFLPDMKKRNLKLEKKFKSDC